jgi:hypothetical protein
VDKGDALRELAAIVGPEIANLDFDDGYVVVQGTDGRTKRIRPGSLDDVFTYPLREYIKEDRHFYVKVEDAIRSLENTAGLSIDWDD